MSTPRRELVLRLTAKEAEALFGAALAGEYEFRDTVGRDPDASAQAKTATLAALDRALDKLRAPE